MNKKKILNYFLLGFISLIILLYQTFPYSILKENIALQVQSILNENKIPLNFSMTSMKPYWVTGVEIENLKLENKFDYKDKLVIKNITTRLSVLSLLLGNLTINSEIKHESGSINTKVTLPLFSILSGEVKLESLKIEAEKFPLDAIFSQLLNVLRLSDKPEMALVTPIISKTKIGGKLFGTITFEETGNAGVDLKLLDSYLNTANEALNIPIQNFSNAGIQFLWDGKKIQIQPKTKFESEDIKFDLGGFIETPSDPNLPWHLDLNLNLKMSGQVEKDFGFLIPQLLNCPANVVMAGVMKIHLVGDSNGLTCQ